MYPRVQPGFAFPSGATYDKNAAERLERRLRALLDRNLR